MGVTEKQLQEAIQTILLSVSVLEGQPVVINDWDMLQRITADDVPMVIIENADDYDNRQDTSVVTTNWVPRLTIITPYANLSDKDAQDLFRDVRQAIINVFRDASRSAGGLSGLDMIRMVPAGPIDYIFDQYVRPEDADTVRPLYIYQTQLLFFMEF